MYAAVSTAFPPLQGQRRSSTQLGRLGTSMSFILVNLSTRALIVRRFLCHDGHRGLESHTPCLKSSRGLTCILPALVAIL
jgi:hypothetical protein